MFSHGLPWLALFIGEWKNNIKCHGQAVADHKLIAALESEFQ